MHTFHAEPPLKYQLDKKFNTMTFVFIYVELNYHINVIIMVGVSGNFDRKIRMLGESEWYLNIGMLNEIME